MWVHHSTTHNSKAVEPTQGPINRELDKTVWYICTRKYYAAIKDGKIMFFAATRVRVIYMAKHLSSVDTVILSQLT